MSEISYLNLLQELVNESEKGNLVKDRTGVGTYNLFHRTLRFDLSKSFPLLTTKRMSLKSIIGEVLWFISGSTNANTLKDKYGCTIWDEWKDEDGELGEVYGSFWRNWRNFNSKTIIKVPIKEDKNKNWVQTIPSFKEPIECDLNNSEMWAIASDNDSKNPKYTFQTYRGFIGEIQRSNWRLLKSVDNVDGFAKNNFGVGYLGNSKSCGNKKLYNLWRNMLSRCYDTTNPVYKMYGGKGVSVSPIWQSYEMFCKTIHLVKFYDCWVKDSGNFSLDKDYFGSNTYSPDTCIFLEKKTNSSMNHKGSCWSIDGVLYPTLSEARRVLGRRFDYVVSELQKGKESCCGFTKDTLFEIKADDGFVYRNEIFFDQISWLINEIKTNPNSRRLYVTSSNPSARYNQALDCCHNYFQVVIKNGKLNLYFQMRSTDVFLGLPYNIASYAILAHMLALETGYDVGELVYSGVDVHLYSNHIEQAKEQLSRKPYSFPKLIVNKKPFFEYALDDFKVEDYLYHPTIKADVAV